MSIFGKTHTFQVKWSLKWYLVLMFNKEWKIMILRWSFSKIIYSAIEFFHAWHSFTKHNLDILICIFSIQFTIKILTSCFPSSLWTLKYVFLFLYPYHIFTQEFEISNYTSSLKYSEIFWNPDLNISYIT